MRKQALVEQLWERSEEGRKETNSKAEYLEPGRKAWETRQDGTGKTEGAKASAAHCGSHCEAEAGRKGKETQRLSSQNPKLKRTKERENSGGQKAERKRRQAVEWKAQRSQKRK